jgi:RNA polymerase sigma-70 factor, ECF subfamily
MVVHMNEPDTQRRPSPGPNSVQALPAPGFDELLPTVYEELHALAAAVLHRSRIVEPTRTTSLVQDVYVRLSGRGLRFKDRTHFLCLAARAMRMVLVDRARRQTAAKRGGENSVLSLDDALVSAASGEDLLAVEESLTRLATFDERKGRVVELRFFGGLSVEETGLALGISPATVKREWTLARAWLLKELGHAGGMGAE